jgi:hypothetical protein
LKSSFLEYFPRVTPNWTILPADPAGFGVASRYKIGFSPAKQLARRKSPDLLNHDPAGFFFDSGRLQPEPEKPCRRMPCDLHINQLAGNPFPGSRDPVAVILFLNATHMNSAGEDRRCAEAPVSAN